MVYVRAEDPDIRERPRILEHARGLSGNCPARELLLLEGTGKLRLQVVHLDLWGQPDAFLELRSNN